MSPFIFLPRKRGGSQKLSLPQGTVLCFRHVERGNFVAGLGVSRIHQNRITITQRFDLIFYTVHSAQLVCGRLSRPAGT